MHHHTWQELITKSVVWKQKHTFFLLHTYYIRRVSFQSQPIYSPLKQPVKCISTPSMSPSFSRTRSSWDPDRGQQPTAQPPFLSHQGPGDNVMLWDPKRWRLCFSSVLEKCGTQGRSVQRHRFLNLVFDSHLPFTAIHPIPLVSDPTGLVWALNVMTLNLGTFEFDKEMVLPAWKPIQRDARPRSFQLGICRSNQKIRVLLVGFCHHCSTMIF